MLPNSTRLGPIAALLAAQVSHAGPLLESGASLDLELIAGRPQVVSVQVLQDASLLVEASQNEIGVVLTARPAGKAVVITVNNPVEDRGVESMLLDVPGIYDVEIRADSDARQGRVRVSTTPLSALTANGRKRIDAERSMTLAASESHVDTLESRRRATQSYEAALAIWRDIADAPQEARTLYFLGMLHMAMNEPSRARMRFEAAGAAFASLGDIAMQANVLSEVGACDMLTADYAAARETFQRALTLHEQIGDRAHAAFDLSNIGLTYHYAGHLADALLWYERALESLRGQDAPRQLAMVTNNIGGVHLERGDADLAIEHFEKAVALALADGDKLNAATGLGNLGYQYRRLGEMDEALDRFQTALQLFRQLDDRREEAWVLSGVASVYRAIGEPDRALVLFEHALERRLEVEDKRGAAVVQSAIGDIYLQQGEVSSARPRFCSALAIHFDPPFAQQLCANRDASVFDALSLDQFEVLTNLARTELAEDDPEGALQILNAAIPAAESAGMRRAVGRAMRVKGEALQVAGDAAAARNAYNGALALLREARDTVSTAETLQALAVLERETGADDRALAHAAVAADVIEQARRRVGSAELRAAFLGTRIDVYELQVELFMEKHLAEPHAGYNRKALAVSERARARSLLDLLDTASVDATKVVDGELAAERRLLQRRVRGKARQQQNIIAREHSTEEAKAAELELQQALTELDLIDARMRSDDVGVPPSVTIDVEAIQRQLDSDTVLLEYALGESHSHAWLVTPTTLRSYRLPRRSEIDGQARRAHASLSTAGPDEDGRDALAWLAQHLLAPLADVGEASRLAIVPDGSLHYIPFGALPLSGAVSSSHPADAVLLERYEIVVLPSASILPALRRPRASEPHEGRVLAVIADPVFSRKDDRIYRDRPQKLVTAQEDSEIPLLHLTRAAPLNQLPPLPGTRAEAEAIAAFAPENSVRLWLGLAASSDAVLEGSLGGYRYLHFATHGHFNDQHPSLSGLVLSQFDADGRQIDGFLGLNEIYGLRFDADLVVLSGCETALGDMLHGEGLIGLTRGFMNAGVPRIIASLWKVPDGATSRLMSSFYRGMLSDGMAPAAALRQAQLDISRDRRLRNPYFWAGFVLQGEWR